MIRIETRNRSVTTMDDRKLGLIRKLMDAQIIEDADWADKLDEPVPLWFVLELTVRLMERVDPPHRPFD
jgi:hypothetical protein